MTTTITGTDLRPFVRGALALEQTERGLVPQRLPARARRQSADPQLVMAAGQPAGVRLALRTTATRISLETIPTKRAYAGSPPRPDGVYELVVDGRPTARSTVDGGDVLAIDFATGSFEHRPGAAGTATFDGLGDAAKDVEVWLPHDEATTLVALRADAPVEPTPPSRPVWLHHGSSISHGSNAEHPLGTWPVVAARAAGADLVNLGLGGGGLLDAFTARAMRDTPADLLSVKVGINLVNTDAMRLRAFTAAVHGFLDTVRDGHPRTPLLVVSPVLCPIHEHVPGPSEIDPAGLAAGHLRFRAAGDPADVAAGRLTLTTIRGELARIVAERAEEDPHLHHLDGRELYGEADARDRPLPDDLHPDTATHRLIGERFAGVLGAQLRR